ncbi:hypothetical protein AOQ84DRAFT_357300, partial [Glonium stellatum]
MLLSWLGCSVSAVWAITLYLPLAHQPSVTRGGALLARLDHRAPLLLRTNPLSPKLARPVQASRRRRQPNQA